MTFNELSEIYQKSDDFGKIKFAEWCYLKGQEDEQKCKEIGIDYTMIFTCDKAD